MVERNLAKLLMLQDNRNCDILGVQVLDKMNNISCGGRCAVGSGGKSVGKPSSSFSEHLSVSSQQ